MKCVRALSEHMKERPSWKGPELHKRSVNKRYSDEHSLGVLTTQMYSENLHALTIMRLLVLKLRKALGKIHLLKAITSVVVLVAIIQSNGKTSQVVRGVEWNRGKSEV